jgi:D-amino peptidase
VRSAAAAAVSENFKVYISADIEGIAGVVNEAHLGPSGFEYQKAREWMTAETVAAATAALEAGATEVVISDSHGNGCNIMPDELPPKCRLVRSWPRELGMMSGLDSSFACAMLIGFHPGTASLGGVRAHTFSSASLTSIKINGVETSESGIAALTAGELGVPIVMASGDNFLEQEIKTTLGENVAVAVVKTALSFVRQPSPGFSAPPCQQVTCHHVLLQSHPSPRVSACWFFVCAARCRVFATGRRASTRKGHGCKSARLF